MSKDCHGRNGYDLVLKVPVGTIIRDSETGEVLADLTGRRRELCVSRRGKGRKG